MAGRKCAGSGKTSGSLAVMDRPTGGCRTAMKEDNDETRKEQRRRKSVRQQHAEPQNVHSPIPEKNKRRPFIPPYKWDAYGGKRFVTGHRSDWILSKRTLVVALEEHKKKENNPMAKKRWQLRKRRSVRNFFAFFSCSFESPHRNRWDLGVVPQLTQLPPLLSRRGEKPKRSRNGTKRNEKQKKRIGLSRERERERKRRKWPASTPGSERNRNRFAGWRAAPSFLRFFRCGGGGIKKGVNSEKKVK